MHYDRKHHSNASLAKAPCNLTKIYSMEYSSLSNKPPDLNFPKTFIGSFSTCFDDKVDNKFISLDAIPKSKVQKKKSVKLNSKKLKSLGLDCIPKDMQKYNIYLEMHQLWKEYMDDFLKEDANKILKAELVGSMITVVESKNPNVVGISGILIRESCNIFYIISKIDKLHKVPKLNTNFKICCKDVSITIHGSNLRYRPSYRSNKKIKLKATVEL